MNTTIIWPNGNKSLLKSKHDFETLLEEPHYLHEVTKKLGKNILLDSVQRSYLNMDDESFNKFGIQLLAKNNDLPFRKYSPYFYFFGPTITGSCNMNCSYCSGCAGNKNPTKTKWESLKAAIDYVSKNKEDIIGDFFMVGEATLEIDLLMKTVAETKKKMKIKMLKLSTNGTGDWEKYKDIIDEFDLFQVSFDGPPEIQNIQRPLKGGGKSSHIVENTIKQLVKHRKKFQIHSMITEMHCGREEYISRYFNDLGIDKIFFSEVAPIGFGIKYLNQDMQKIFNAKYKIIELLELSGVEAKPGVDQLLGHKDRLFCPLGYAFNISSEGNIFTCTAFSDDALKKETPDDWFLIGKYDNEHKTFVMDKDKIENLRELHKKAACENCDTKLCWGGCPHRNIKTTGDMTKPDKAFCEGRKMDISMYMQYLVERDVIRIKPYLLEKKGRQFFSTQFTDFLLSKDTFQDNPIITFDPVNCDFNKLFSEIIKLNNKNKKKLYLFLLSPVSTTRLDVRRSIELKELLFALKENNILFRITKPLRITGSGEVEENDFYNEFSIPKSCLECLEMFKVNNNVVKFCNGLNGPKLTGIFDRDEIYEAFKKTGSNPDCLNLSCEI